MLQCKSKPEASLVRAFTTATEEASSAMHRWTGGSVVLTLEEVYETTLEEAVPSIEIGDEPLSIVVLQITGEFPGDMMLAFAESDAQRLASDLAASVSGGDVSNDEWQRSALMETGNILCSAYLNALTDLVEEPLLPSPPYFIQDYGVTVFEQVLMQHALTAETIFLNSTTFRRNETDRLNGHLFFIPGEELRGLISQRLKRS